MSDAILSVIRDRVLQPKSTGAEDDPIEVLIAKIHERHAGKNGLNAQGEASGVAAILVYGSYLRGKRDTLLDFYVLLDDFSSMPKPWHAYTARVLAPNVYNIQVGEIPNQARAKYAALSIAQFENAMTRQFHSYFWARFAQPCGLVFARDAAIEHRVLCALRAAVYTFYRRVLPLVESPFTSEAFWELGLSQTYRCELRAEATGQARKLSQANADYFSQLTLAAAQATDLMTVKEGLFEADVGERSRQRAVYSWGVRRVQGKFLSIARLLKATTTFENALEYLLWKIQRHSGVYLAPTDRQLRYPLIFAWPLLWRLYRLGAFK